MNGAVVSRPPLALVFACPIVSAYAEPVEISDSFFVSRRRRAQRMCKSPDDHLDEYTRKQWLASSNECQRHVVH